MAHQDFMNFDLDLLGPEVDRNMTADSEGLDYLNYHALSSNGNYQVWESQAAVELIFLPHRMNVSDIPSLSPPAFSLDPPECTTFDSRTYCFICEKHLNRPQDLRRHYRTHTGIRDFLCVPCGDSFSRSDALKRHQRTCAACPRS